MSPGLSCARQHVSALPLAAVAAGFGAITFPGVACSSVQFYSSLPFAVRQRSSASAMSCAELLAQILVRSVLFHRQGVEELPDAASVGIAQARMSTT